MIYKKIILRYSDFDIVVYELRVLSWTSQCILYKCNLKFWPVSPIDQAILMM